MKSSESSFRIGDWLVEPLSNRLVRGDSRVKLDPKVMQVLLYLSARPNEVAEKEEILSSVWNGVFVTDEVLTNAIFELRKALGDDAKEPRFIQTVPRKGYRLLAAVEGATGVPRGAESTAVPVPAPGRGRVVAGILVAAIVGSVAVWSWMRLAGSRTAVPSRFDILLPTEEALTHLNDPVVAWSPDGARLVHRGGTPGRLYVHPIDRLMSTPIPGTEGAWTAFFSPDGEWIAYYGDGMLKKVQLENGSAVALCEAPNAFGASWGDDDTILFAPTLTSGLFRVSASGGESSAVTEPDPSRDEIAHRFPEFLPGAKAALFTIWTGSTQTSRIAVLRLETGEYRELVDGASFARYSSTGHLVYARQSSLEAARFNLETLEVTGPPVPLDLEVRSVGDFGTAHFSVSRLAYVPASGPTVKTLLWVDRNGWSRPLTQDRKDYNSPRFSPDGKRFAVTIVDGAGAPGVWIYDLEREALTD
jgi:DNA-binding winged helix-turn-helix (wHTH) protein